MSEPDRFEEKAREVVDVVIDCMNGKTDHAGCRTGDGVDHVAAALRAAADEMRQASIDACDDAIGALQGDREVEAALECIKRIRALASPAAAPAADEVSGLLGRGHIRNPREGEPGDAETYSSPAPLLPRVLAALEQEASAHDDFDSTYEHAAALALRALAAELRTYIADRAAKVKGEGR